MLRVSAPTSALSSALAKATTIEPPFSQRKFKYRKAPGIGTGDVSRIDPIVVVKEHELSTAPAEAIEVDLGPIVLRAWITNTGSGSEVRVICINDPKAGFPWAEALAERTGDFLTDAGSRFNVEVLKGRG